jgi:hypothetical protein
MSDSQQMTEPAKLLLLASILAKGRVISNNGKAFLKVGNPLIDLVHTFLSPTPSLETICDFVFLSLTHHLKLFLGSLRRFFHGCTGAYFEA